MEETYSWQHSVTTDIFSIEGDKIELEWPEETLWKITSDRSPCEVCEHAYTYTAVTHHTGNLLPYFMHILPHVAKVMVCIHVCIHR